MDGLPQIDPKDDIDYPIREFTEDDLRNSQTLALTRPRVLNAVCKVMNIYLTTRFYSQKVDMWTATLPGGGIFTGSLEQMAIYIHGYARAWSTERSKARLLLSNLEKTIKELKENMR